MAKRSRTKLYVTGGRDDFSSSLTALPWPKLALPGSHYDPPFIEIEDRRTYHPAGDFRPARMLSGHSHTPVVVKRSNRPFRPMYPFHIQRFAVPEKTVLCIRRKKRREVLFARRRAGRRGQKKPRFNWYSKISCKR